MSATATSNPSRKDEESCEIDSSNISGSNVPVGGNEGVKSNKDEEPGENESETTDLVEDIPKTRVELEMQIQQAEREIFEAAKFKNFKLAREKTKKKTVLVKLKETLPPISELLLQLNKLKKKSEEVIKRLDWDEAEKIEDEIKRVEAQVKLEKDASKGLNRTTSDVLLSTTQHTVPEQLTSSLQIDQTFLRNDNYRRAQSNPPEMTVGLFEEQQPPRLYDRLIVFQAAPLVITDPQGTAYPFPGLDFDYERKVLEDALKEDSEIVDGEIDLVFEAATTDRLGAFLAAGNMSVLHFSTHGHPSYLCLEDGKGRMQALPNEQLREFISSARPAGDNSRGLRVVFVSACHSAEAGKAFIEAGVPHVVCCKQDSQVRDKAASLFATSFYRALACRKGLRESFEMAKQAVKTSRSFDEPHKEANKFLLLPAKPDDDPYHDVQVFYTQQIQQMQHRRHRKLPSNRVLPPPPDIFLGREKAMFEVLEKLSKGARVIRLIGVAGIGKASLAKAVCRYINDRMRTFFLEQIIWLPLLGNLSEDDNLFIEFRQLFAMFKSGSFSDTDVKNHCGRIVNQLYEKRVLIFIDARDLNPPSGLVHVGVFLREIVRGTKNVKVVVVCPSGNDIHPQKLCIDVGIPVEPLSLKSSVLLFGKMCPFVAQHTSTIVHTPVEMLNLLVPESQAHATVISNSMSKRCKRIFSIIGEGNPSRVLSSATDISEKEYATLIRVGQRPEFHVKINTRHELEDEITRSKQRLDAAKKKHDFRQAQSILDNLEELENLREKLPSFQELRAQEAKCSLELKQAISRESFVKAHDLNCELEGIKAKIKKEEETNPSFSSNENGVRDIKTLAELEHKIRETTEQMKKAGEEGHFDCARSKKKELTALNNYRENLPSVKELADKLSKLEEEKAAALKATDYDLAESLHSKMKETEAQISLEKGDQAKYCKINDAAVGDIELSAGPKFTSVDVLKKATESGFSEEKVEELRELFSNYDFDDDEYISVSEVRQILTQLGLKPWHAEWGRTAEAGSDKINFDVFLDLMKSRSNNDVDDQEDADFGFSADIQGCPIDTPGQHQPAKTIIQEIQVDRGVKPLAAYKVGSFHLILSKGSLVNFSYSNQHCGIVSATNEGISLQPDGVDGTVSAAGGQTLHEEIARLEGIHQSIWGPIRCETGDAKRLGPHTYGNLKVPHIIFAVGPDYSFVQGRDTLKQKDALLRSAYRSSLKLAKEAKLEAVAFSLLSAGNRGGKRDRARSLRVGMKTICEFGGYEELKEIHMVGFKAWEVETLLVLAQNSGLQEDASSWADLEKK